MGCYKLAIVIPSWNCNDYIAEMLDDILVQSFQDWKLYVVDDQSTDFSLEIIKKYAQKDNRIHYMIRDREPKGAQTCRNIGYDLTEGAEYVMWLDADDKIAPYCFEQRVEYMDGHPGLDFGVFPAITFQDQLWEERAGCYGLPFWEDSLQAILLQTFTMVGWTNIYRRDSFGGVRKIWDENLLSMQDTDFNIQNLISGKKFDFAVKEGARVDYYYRTKTNSQRVSEKISTMSHYGSHLYLLQKITTAMSSIQKQQYHKELELYFYYFAKVFANSVDYYDQLFHIPWVNENRLFKLRLWFWKTCHFHLGRKIFFRKIALREDLIKEKRKCLVESHYEQLRKNVTFC